MWHNVSAFFINHHSSVLATYSKIVFPSQEDEGAEHLFRRLQDSPDDALLHFDIVCIPIPSLFPVPLLIHFVMK